MNKNDIVRLSISDLGTDGEGIGKIDGFTLFVKDAIPGDEIEAKLVKLKKNFGYARVERVLKPSPFRVIAPCENARRCGGCQIMELEYNKQLEFKENKVKNNLIRIGGFDERFINEIMEPIVGMDGEALRYRNKAQFPFGKNKDGETVCGFYAGRTHSIIPSTECLLGVPENKVVLETILSYMKENKIEPYNEENGTGLIRHVLIRKGFTSGEIMVCLVINGNKLPCKEKLVEQLLKLNVGIKSISISINTSKTNVIMGDNFHTVWGADSITDIMRVRKPENNFSEFYSEEGIEFSISPLSFYQVNPIQVEKLYGIAVSYAALTGKEEVWDICCGIGTITLSMAGNAKKVHGIEIVPPAIEDAKFNAKKNNIDNAEFICAAAEEYLPAHKDEIKADVIVLDPPRKGMDEKALLVVTQAMPERIVYVSCDSATLARDLKYICEHGYKLEKFRCCDLFSQTVHVETVVLITRKE